MVGDIAPGTCGVLGDPTWCWRMPHGPCRPHITPKDPK